MMTGLLVSSSAGAGVFELVGTYCFAQLLADAGADGAVEEAVPPATPEV